ncbi:MAG: methylmalonyl Co-A mutase-associated GTPase MeaB [Acidimicrobiales bacterium]
MRRREPTELLDAALKGDRAAIARLITLVEEGGETAREVARAIYPHTGRAHTIGITGAPGAGKSTLTDRLITTARATGAQVGVLAVDPSSPFSGGAFLGDRVRMQEHATDPSVFIRSMATRGHLGGLAQAAPEAIRVLDATGHPWVLVETVGVGQVEVDIAGATDTTLVVLTPGSGDGVQANKAGLLEIADLFVINKADRPGVKELERDLLTMLELGATDPPWRPPILTTVATTGEGVSELWEAIAQHRAFLAQAGRLAERRMARLERELRDIVARRLEHEAWSRCQSPVFGELLAAVTARRLDPWAAADQLVAGAFSPGPQGVAGGPSPAPAG